MEPGEVKFNTSKDCIQVPSSWNKYMGNEKQSGYGYATYRLQFITAKNFKLGLRIPRMFIAYNLWCICQSKSVPYNNRKLYHLV